MFRASIVREPPKGYQQAQVEFIVYMRVRSCGGPGITRAELDRGYDAIERDSYATRLTMPVRPNLTDGLHRSVFESVGITLYTMEVFMAHHIKRVW